MRRSHATHCSPSIEISVAAFRLVLSVAIALGAGCTTTIGDGATDLADLPQLTLHEDLRLGNADDPDVGFSRIGSVTVDREGRIYVLERQDRHVRVYDRIGDRLRVIGRTGEGPGEFRAVASLGLLGDTLWVHDPAGRRFTMFDSLGTVLTTLPIPPVNREVFPGVRFLFFASRLRNDGLIATTFGVPLTANPPRDSVWIPHLLLDRGGGIVDTARWERWAYPVYEVVRVGGQSINVPPPPSSQPLHLESDGGAYIVEREIAGGGSSGTFTVVRIGVEGDTLFRHRFRYQPAAFPPTAINALIAPSLRTLTTVIRDSDGTTREVFLQGGDTDSSAAVTAIRNALALPPFQPPIAAGRVAEDHTLWLRLHDDGLATFRWLLIEPDGTPHGILSLPRTATVHWSQGTEFWAETADDTDVPWLIRYRVPPVR